MPVEAIESREEARKGKQCQRIGSIIMHDFLLTRNESHDEGMMALKSSKRAFQLNNNY
jgi:hypothetical protein